MHAAFLRGMNVGGHRITNADLTKAFSDIGGFADVACFRASGNVVFSAAARESEAKLIDRIEAGLRGALGYEVPVFIRSADEVRAIAALEPFPADAVAATKGKLQVSFLAKKPAAKAREAVLALSTDADRLAFEGRELYWLPTGGISDSELDLDTIGKTLGVSTMRTMGTVQQIAKKYFGD